jgi:endogenous inhibitor of DNA gyrase (YacG/DUF329 family)
MNVSCLLCGDPLDSEAANFCSERCREDWFRAQWSTDEPEPEPDNDGPYDPTRAGGLFEPLT